MSESHTYLSPRFKLTSRPISVFLQLPKQVYHAPMQIVRDEFLMIIASQCWDKLDDSSADEGFAMVFVAQDLLAYFVVSLLHEL